MGNFDYLERRIRVSTGLAKGDCEGNYGDAVLILGSVVSGIAADLYPGMDQIDRKRFVETWIRFAEPNLGSRRISIPLLWDWLRAEHRTDELGRIEDAWPEFFGPGQVARVIHGPEIDQEEASVARVCPALSVKQRREWSYANVFYRHVRSALTHEGHLEGLSTQWQQSIRDSPINYANELLKGDQTRRQIHFGAFWLADLARSIIGTAPQGVPAAGLPRPSIWWIDGSA